MNTSAPIFDRIPGPPDRRQLGGEAKGLLEPLRLALRFPALASKRRQRGVPVLVLPGFGTSDRATWLLRRYVSYLGHPVEGWELGRNNGRVPELIPRVIDRVETMAKRHGRPVALVGWSLGGYLAREAARERPELVARVVTLGSPVVGGPKYTVTHAYYARNGYDLDEIEATVAAREAVPLKVPVTAIFSKDDRVVAWQACIDRLNPMTEHVEVNATHIGLGLSPDVYAVVADRLAEPG